MADDADESRELVARTQHVHGCELAKRDVSRGFALVGSAIAVCVACGCTALALEMLLPVIVAALYVMLVGVSAGLMVFRGYAAHHHHLAALAVLDARRQLPAARVVAGARRTST